MIKKFQFDLQIILNLYFTSPPIDYLKLVLQSQLIINAKTSINLMIELGRLGLSISNRKMHESISEILNLMPRVQYSIIITLYMSLKQERTVQAKSLLSHYTLQVVLPFKIIQKPSRKASRYERDGHWNEKERLKYAIFLTYFQNLFEDPIKKKSVRIYDMMSDMIITRNSNQCRSHHQKMEKYRSTIPDIIGSVAEKYEPRVYKELEERYLILIKMLLENQERYIRDSTNCQRSRPNIQQQPEAKSNRKNKQRVEEIEVSQALIQNHQLEQQIQNFKDKQDKIRTAQSYAEYKEGNEDQQNEQIPMMTLQDPKNIEKDAADPSNQFNQNYQGYENMSLQCSLQPSFIEGGFFSMEQGMQLTLEGRQYYEEQIKIFEMKKQWHVQNAQMLSAQLIAEKQSIQQCDIALKFFQLACNPQKTN